MKIQDNYIRKCQLIRAVDGDTVDLEVDFGQRLYKKDRYRLSGIDTPERGDNPGFKNATDFLVNLIEQGSDENGWFYCQTLKHGKFRWMATLFSINGEDMNVQMISSGHARPYGGGKKR